MRCGLGGLVGRRDALRLIYTNGVVFVSLKMVVRRNVVVVFFFRARVPGYISQWTDAHNNISAAVAAPAGTNLGSRHGSFT